MRDYPKKSEGIFSQECGIRYTETKNVSTERLERVWLMITEVTEVERGWLMNLYGR